MTTISHQLLNLNYLNRSLLRFFHVMGGVPGVLLHFSAAGGTKAGFCAVQKIWAGSTIAEPIAGAEFCDLLRWITCTRSNGAQ